MKIRLLGFDLQAGNGITLADLFAHLASKQNSPIDFHGYERLLYVGENKKYHLGLLITTKDQKKFLELSQTGGAVKFEPRDVTTGARLADFNFFLLDKNTGRGIYQYYHNSCSLNPFAYLLRKCYDELKQEKIDASISKLTSPTESSKAKIKKQYSGTLQWTQIVRPENFEALVGRLQSINTFTVSMATLDQKESAFRSISSLAKKVVHEFKFSNDKGTNAIIRSITNFIKRDPPESARVDGIDEDGLEQVIKLTNNPDSFGEFEYDEVTEKMDFLPKDFVSSWFMKEITKIADANSVLLMTKTRP